MTGPESKAERNPKDYASYPQSGRFRFHGAGKDYYRAWEAFLKRETDEEPPEFWQFAEEWERQFETFGRAKALLGRIRAGLHRGGS